MTIPVERPLGKARRVKTLTFVRHGQSVANAGGITVEHAEIQLSVLGQLQAQALAELLPDNPSQILVSEYARAQSTAQPYGKRVGMTTKPHPLLHEFSAIDPALLQGMNGEQRRPHADAYWSECDPEKRTGEKAEKFSEFDHRVASFLTELNQFSDGTVLFGHGIWIGLMIWKLLGFSVVDSNSMKAFRRFQLGLPMPNCAVYRLMETEPGQWRAELDEVIKLAMSDVKQNLGSAE